MSLLRGGTDATAVPSHLLTLSALRVVSLAPGQGFTGVRATPIRVLSHVLASYLTLLGTAAKRRAEASGRTSVSFADALGAVEEVGMSIHALIELVYQLKASAPRSEAERERTRALHNSGLLLRNVVNEPKQGRKAYYELFSEEELIEFERQALERAAQESEEEEEAVPQPPPRLPSTSSSDLSDLSDEEGTSRMRIDEPPKQKTPERPLKRKAVFDEELEAEEAAYYARWRDPACIPEHVPPYLPPLPGFAKGDRVDDEADIKVEGKEGFTRPAHIKQVRQATSLTNTGELWRSTIPFEWSKLAEMENLPPAPEITEAPDFELKEEGSMNAFHKLQQRLLDMPKQPEQLRPDEKRRKVARLLLNHRLDAHDTLYGNIPPDAYRQSARSAGWVPYAFDQLGRPSVYLRDFDGPLIDSLSTSTIAQPATFAPPAGRSPAILSHLTRQLAQQAPSMASRLLRLAPPGPVDENGNTIPYLLDDKGAKLAVQLPAHQSPLYFVPGWFWRSRDPLDETLPNEIKAPPVSAIEPETAVPETALEGPSMLELPATGEGAVATEGEEKAAVATDEPLAAVEPVDGMEVSTEVKAESEQPASRQASLKPGSRLPSVQPEELSALQPAFEEQPALARERMLTVSSAEGGFTTPLDGTPAPSNRSGSIPLSASALPPFERRPSEALPKIKLKIKSSQTPIQRQPSPIDTKIERQDSPGAYAAPTPVLATPVVATPVSAGGTKLKLKLSFGGSRPKSESVAPPLSAVPEASPVVIKQEEEPPLVPMASPKQAMASAGRISEEPEDEGPPLVAMPPPKKRSPSTQLMSPVVLQTNGTQPNGTAHTGQSPP